MSLNLYPNAAKRAYKQANNDGFWVFKNNERLDIGVDIQTNTSPFYSQFYSPCYRIPSIVITDSGRIIIGADYRSKPNDQTAIMPAVAYSDDNGRTWKKKIIDKEPVNGENAYSRIMDQTMFINDGVINILCGAWDGSANNKNWTQTRNDRTFQVIRYYSNDNGETWYRENHFENSIKTNPINDGSSWLGGVGNCVKTKHGTMIVPIQISRAVGKVNLSYIYSTDGVNWTKHASEFENGSETSCAQYLTANGTPEILFIGRRDPNDLHNKFGCYITEPSAGNPTQLNVYGQYDGKIPALGGAGCCGGLVSMCDGEKNLSEDGKQNYLVSYTHNFLYNISNYIRDNIKIASFAHTQKGNNSSRVLKDIETINFKAGVYGGGIPYGGYSNLYFNPKCNKLGIVYEDSLGIKFKNLSYLIPQLQYRQ